MMDGQTDRRTDRQTDKAGCRVACMRLKTQSIFVFILLVLLYHYVFIYGDTEIYKLMLNLFYIDLMLNELHISVIYFFNHFL